MPLTPIPGSVRLRQLQLGQESTFKTAVAATRRMPWQSTPTFNKNWTFPTADTGTLDQAIPPYAGLEELGFQTSGQLASNDAPTLISAGVMGGLSLTGAGTAKTLSATPTSTSQDPFDTYTAEWGDDSTDVFQLAGCVIDSLTLDYPEDQSPIMHTATWIAADIATYPATFTGSLNVDLAPVYLEMADTEFYVDDAYGNIETTKLTSIAHSASFALANNIDRKRFANGSNTRKQVQNYGRGERVVTFSLVGAKQSAWVSEAQKWVAASPTERFFGLKTTANVIITGTTPHSLDIRLPGFWMERSEQTVNANTAFQLSAHQVYDPNLAYPFKIVSVSSRAAL